MEFHDYPVNIVWEKSRIGTISAPEIAVQFPVATPPEFAGGVAGFWSPEHLYTASVVTCFMTTFLAIAELSKLNFASFACSATGTLEKIDGKYLMTKVTLNPTVTIAEEKDIERTNRILQKSESNCLISNSIKSTVILNPTVLVQS